MLETENLRLRNFVVSDGEFVVRLLNTPGWLEYIGNRDIETVEEAQIYLLTGPMSSYEKFGFGLYLVELKDSRIPIGMCGLIKREGLENIDLGFAFLPEFAGKGYAFEAANVTLEFAKEQLKLSRLVSITQSNNSRAIALLERLGFRYEKEVQLPNEDTVLLLFDKTMTAEKILVRSGS